MFRRVLTSALAGLLAIGSAAASAETIGIASIPVGAINHLQAQIFAKVVQQHAGLQTRVIPVGGTTATLASLEAKAAEFTNGDVTNMRSAVEGSHSFPRPFKNLRVVLTYNNLLIGIMVRNRSPIKTFADLKGKRFPTGWPEFPNGIPLTNGLFATAGYTIDDMDPVPAAGLFPAADDFKAGKTDATSIALVAPKVREIDAAIPGGIRFLSVEKTPAALAAMRKVRRDYFIATVKPSPAFVGILGPTNVLAVPSVVTAGAHVSDEIVYKFVKAVAEHKADMVKGHPSFRPLDVTGGIATMYSGLEHHPGAIKYYREKGIWKGN